MAVIAAKEKSTTKKKRGGFGGSGKGRRGIVRNVFTVIGIIVIVLMLFGAINQAVVGHSYFSWLVDRGYEVGATLNSVVKQDDQSPVNVTDEGIYVNGFEPDSATKLIPQTDATTEED